MVQCAVSLFLAQFKLGGNMRRRAILACALVFLAGTVRCPAQAAIEITFGITSGTALSLAHYVASEQRYYEAENLKVDTIVAGAAVGVLQQLAAGSLNIAQAATDQSLRAILRGAPIRIVAGAVSNAPFRAVAAKTVTSWSDLKGKTISVGGLTDVTLYFLRVMARRNGLADRDYDLLYGGSTPNRFAQLVSGVAAAAILTNPVDFTALEQGFADLGSVTQYLPNWAQNNILADTRWAQRNRAALVAFVSAGDCPRRRTFRGRHQGQFRRADRHGRSQRAATARRLHRRKLPRRSLEAMTSRHRDGFRRALATASFFRPAVWRRHKGSPSPRMPGPPATHRASLTRG